ncbi:MAG TPA: hypothetical protein VHS09_06980, partial [Polyangiaceae bacterium]|nr:hypothetical protein [Polyangiaceae bacterium]
GPPIESQVQPGLGLPKRAEQPHLGFGSQLQFPPLGQPGSAQQATLFPVAADLSHVKLFGELDISQLHPEFESVVQAIPLDGEDDDEFEEQAI